MPTYFFLPMCQFVTVDKVLWHSFGYNEGKLKYKHLKNKVL